MAKTHNKKAMNQEYAKARAAKPPEGFDPAGAPGGESKQKPAGPSEGPEGNTGRAINDRGGRRRSEQETGHGPHTAAMALADNSKVKNHQQDAAKRYRDLLLIPSGKRSHQPPIPRLGRARKCDRQRAGGERDRPLDGRAPRHVSDHKVPEWADDEEER
jgi:hypothetical protein